MAVSVPDGALCFDLNLDKVLAFWTQTDALRELVANALDEHIITKRPDAIQIQHLGNVVTVKDLGRGIRPEHFQFKQSQEKLSGETPGVCGIHGGGLKDSLACLYQKGHAVIVKSAHCQMTFGIRPKHDFPQIMSLHGFVLPGIPGMIGTEILINKITPEQLQETKSLFLQLVPQKVLDNNDWGEVLRKQGESANIYINGLLVSQESDYNYSYNITKLNTEIRRRLNRDRNNLGRSAFSAQIANIVRHCTDPSLLNEMQQAFQKRHEEDLGADLRLNEARKFLAALPEPEGHPHPHGEQKAQIPEQKDHSILGEHAGPEMDKSGDDEEPHANANPENQDEDGDIKIDQTPIVSLKDPPKKQRPKPPVCTDEETRMGEEVPVSQLTSAEREVYKQTEPLLRLLPGIFGHKRFPIKVVQSITIRGRRCLGGWLPAKQTVAVAREQLRSKADFFATVLHEMLHGVSHHADGTVEFETALTEIMGVLASLAVK